VTGMLANRSIGQQRHAHPILFVRKALQYQSQLMEQFGYRSGYVFINIGLYFFLENKLTIRPL
jgi:hypothetical protein